MTLELAKALHQDGRLDEAKAAYLLVLGESPNNVEALHMLSVVYAEEGAYQEAEECLLAAIDLAQQDTRLPLHLANVFKAAGRHDDAIALLNKLIDENPSFAAAHNNLGTVYAALKNWQQAVEQYQAAIKCQDNYIDAYYNLGLAQIKLHQYEVAKHTFDALLSLSPSHVGGLFQKACLLMRQEEYRKACDIFADIVKAYPNHFESVVNLATCLLKLGKLQEAKRAYHKASDLNQNDIQVLFNLGVVNSQLGLPKKAIEAYLLVLAISPQSFEAHYNLGTLYHYLKDKDAALTHLRAALNLQPGNEMLKHTMQIVAGQQPSTLPPEQYIHDLFDSYADHYEQHVTETLGYQVPQAMQALLDARGFIPSNQWRVLDLGCGTGLSGVPIKPYAAHLEGVDLSPKMLALAAEKGIYDELEESSLHDHLVRLGNQYDFIVAADVLVYFAELETILQDIWQALADDGYVMFSTEVAETEEAIHGQHGRFAHSQAYVESILAKQAWQLVTSQPLTLRVQEGSPVAGTLWLCQKGS